MDGVGWYGHALPHPRHLMPAPPLPPPSPKQARSARTLLWVLWSGFTSSAGARCCTTGRRVGSPKFAFEPQPRRWVWVCRRLGRSLGVLWVSMRQVIKEGDAGTACSGTGCAGRGVSSGDQDRCRPLHPSHCRSCASWPAPRLARGCPLTWCRMRVGGAGGGWVPGQGRPRARTEGSRRRGVAPPARLSSSDTSYYCYHPSHPPPTPHPPTPSTHPRRPHAGGSRQPHRAGHRPCAQKRHRRRHRAPQAAVRADPP